MILSFLLFLGGRLFGRFSRKTYMIELAICNVHTCTHYKSCLLIITTVRRKNIREMKSVSRVSFSKE